MKGHDAERAHRFATEKAMDIPGLESPYAIQATLVWKARGEDGLDNIRDVMSNPQMKAVQDDIANFTNTPPVVLLGTVKAADQFV